MFHTDRLQHSLSTADLVKGGKYSQNNNCCIVIAIAVLSISDGNNWPPRDHLLPIQGPGPRII